MSSKLDGKGHLNTIPTIAKCYSDDTISDDDCIIKITEFIQDNYVNPLFSSLIYNMTQAVTNEIHKLPFPGDLTLTFSSNTPDATAKITTKEQKLVRFISKIYEHELQVLKDYCDRNIFNVSVARGSGRKRWKNNACQELWHLWNLHDSKSIYMTSKGEDIYNSLSPTTYENNNKALIYNLVPKHLDDIPTPLALENIRHKVMKLQVSLRLSHMKSSELRYKIKKNNILTATLKRIEYSLIETLSYGVEEINNCSHDQDVNIERRMRECQGVIKVVVSYIERLKSLIIVSQNLSSQLDNIKILRKVQTDNNNSTREYTKILGDACKYALRELEGRDNERNVEVGAKRNRMLTLDEEYELRKDIIQWPLASKIGTLINSENERDFVNVRSNMVLNELWKRMKKKVSL